MTPPARSDFAVIRSKRALAEQVTQWHETGLTIGLVPTMGALHHGHLALVKEAARHSDRVIVSIFVNPAQFGEGEDFADYPRTEEADLAALDATEADAVYLPSLEDMYPAGATTRVHAGPLTRRWEGEHRPGHFDGVATIVTKLILQSQADIAVFGEKDFQQLAVIRRVVADLDIPVEIVGAPVVREDDGLAASSRNRYLSEAERQVAGQINLILADMVKQIQAGHPVRQTEKAAVEALLAAGVNSVDYVAVIDPDTLEPVDDGAPRAQAILVARVGRVRLLDTMTVCR